MGCPLSISGLSLHDNGGYNCCPGSVCKNNPLLSADHPDICPRTLSAPVPDEASGNSSVWYQKDHDKPRCPRSVLSLLLHPEVHSEFLPDPRLKIFLPVRCIHLHEIHPEEGLSCNFSHTPKPTLTQLHTVQVLRCLCLT